MINYINNADAFFQLFVTPNAKMVENVSNQTNVSVVLDIQDTDVKNEMNVSKHSSLYTPMHKCVHPHENIYKHRYIYKYSDHRHNLYSLAGLLMPLSLLIVFVSERNSVGLWIWSKLQVTRHSYKEEKA